MSEKLTPLLRQYFRLKKQYPDRILFFRMGDFYEMFGDDAKIASEILGITLTSRNHGKDGRVPLAGVPYHQAEKYLPKLLKAGYGVAVCEQIEDPKKAKGLVERDVIEVITPGSVTVQGVLDDGVDNFIAALNPEGNEAGIALADYTTGRFVVDQLPIGNLDIALGQFQPAELLVPESYSGDSLGIPLYRTENFRFDRIMAENVLLEHFGTDTLDGFGCERMPLAVGAAGALLDYLKRLKKGQVDHLRSLSRIVSGDRMYLDQATITNLELVEGADGMRQHSLLGILDRCHTAMGRRLMRSRIITPLIDKNMIRERQRYIQAFYENPNLAGDISEILRDIKDVERMLSRFVAGRATPRDLASLKESFSAMARLKSRLAEDANFADYSLKLDDFGDLLSKFGQALVDNPPVSYLEGGIFRPGYSAQLDRLNEEVKEARVFMRSLQEKERQRTGISSLKVGYNRIYGYYIEVTKANSKNIPQEYIRKQTLVSAERYITEEMKEKEELILDAEEKINLLEAELFLELKGIIKDNSQRILNAAALVAEIDFYQSLGSVARANHYVMPTILDFADSPDGLIEIKNGRHPVIEKTMPPGEFVPNDTLLNVADQRVHIITGPNMAGKSTYIRQVGLIALMAQIGGFVPADKAVITIADRIFTRVGASDRLAKGQSTFMVEMTETANIVNNATPKSLILLDELGRGTSTYDGLSLAWAITEFISDNRALRCRTLFATHYHELTEIANVRGGVVNFQVAVKEVNDRIIFLRKIKAGGCDDSYGIEVARLAGIPDPIINRAKSILSQLEKNQASNLIRGKTRMPEPQSIQISLFDPENAAIAEKIKSLDLDNLTPLEALQLLKTLKDELN